MESFSISNIYRDELDRKTIDINPLPDNYCSFDCVFCPLGRTQVLTDQNYIFEETKEFMNRLEYKLKNEPIDIVFINPNGEALANKQLVAIINLIKNYNIKIKLLSNGYLINRKEYINILNLCDEVIGELAITNEHDFQRLQRPIESFTLSKYITNMSKFNQQYTGKFILAITILKNHSDKEEDIEKFKEFIDIINPDEVFLETPTKDKLKQAFGVSPVTLSKIKKELQIK